MGPLLAFSRTVDRFNRGVGRCAVWLILASVLISAANAVSRKLFDASSNAWLEMQWYLFSASFLGAAAYVLMVDEHVRIDAVAQRFPPRLRAWIDIATLLLVVLPLCALLVRLGGSYFWAAYRSGEMSYNTGGLIRWPVRLTIPVGFGLLGLQALSELVKRVAFLRGLRSSAAMRETDLPEFMGPAPRARR